MFTYRSANIYIYICSQFNSCGLELNSSQLVISPSDGKMCALTRYLSCFGFPPLFPSHYIYFQCNISLEKHFESCYFFYSLKSTK